MGSVVMIGGIPRLVRRLTRRVRADIQSIDSSYKVHGMTQRAEFDKIELHLIRVLHTLITERSVSRAALQLDSTQPAVSAQLKRLRELTGDPLLVRAGNRMAPTDAGLATRGPGRRTAAARRPAVQPAQPQRGLRAARPARSPSASPPATTSIRCSCRTLVTQLKQQAPQVPIELLPLSGDFDYRAQPGHRRGRPGDRQLAAAAG